LCNGAAGRHLLCNGVAGRHLLCNGAAGRHLLCNGAAGRHLLCNGAAGRHLFTVLYLSCSGTKNALSISSLITIFSATLVGLKTLPNAEGTQHSV
jgi:hypothetical protein